MCCPGRRGSFLIYAPRAAGACKIPTFPERAVFPKAQNHTRKETRAAATAAGRCGVWVSRWQSGSGHLIPPGVVRHGGWPLAKPTALGGDRAVSHWGTRNAPPHSGTWQNPHPIRVPDPASLLLQGGSREPLPWGFVSIFIEDAKCVRLCVRCERCACV